MNQTENKQSRKAEVTSGTKPRIIKFQVTQNWGQGTKAYEYFDAPENTPVSKLEQEAIQVIKDEWNYRKKNHLGFSAPEKCKPKIKVAEYAEGRKVKGGIRFETRWR